MSVCPNCGKEHDAPTGFICGPSTPAVGSRVSMRRELHDNGFGNCAVFVSGLYGQTEDRFFCNFAAFPNSHAWKPTEFPPKRLSWLEKRLKGWDTVWPEAKWRIELAWPFQSETWEREKAGLWRVTKVGRGIA